MLITHAHTLYTHRPLLYSILYMQQARVHVCICRLIIRVKGQRLKYQKTTERTPIFRIPIFSFSKPSRKLPPICN